MTELSNFAENLLMDWLMTTGTATRPTAWYMGLYSAAPSDAGGGTEISGNGYARQAVTFSAAASRATANTNNVDFTPSGGDWAEATHFGIFDASTAGNLLFWSPLDANVTALNGVTYRFAIGDIDIAASAGNLSDFAANLCLDWLLTNGTATRPTAWYLSLHEASNTELAGGGYARQEVAWDAAASGATANTGAETFGPATGSDWVAATKWGVYDASTAGNQLWLDDLTASRTVTVGGSAPAAAGDFDLAFD